MNVRSARFYAARSGDNLMYVRGNVDTVPRANWRMAVSTLESLRLQRDVSEGLKIDLVSRGLNLHRQPHVSPEAFESAIVKTIGELDYRPKFAKNDIRKLLKLADDLYIHKEQVRMAIEDLVASKGAKVFRVEDLRLSPEGLHTFSALVVMEGEADLYAHKLRIPLFPVLEKPEIRAHIREILAAGTTSDKKPVWEPLIVVGGALEDDAHTVGIDAIMQAKGIHGYKGMEALNVVGDARYIEPTNLLAQVSCERLVEEAISRKAHMILVSRILVEGNLYLRHMEKLNSLVKDAKARGRLSQDTVIIVGGPRLDELQKVYGKGGYDQIAAVFGREANADEVLSFWVDMKNRQEEEIRRASAYTLDSAQQTAEVHVRVLTENADK
ncbi:cobalamin B12-binding domain-containing protein [Candidatus Saganbacteria bacterium]|nr:cobalamin B12-binding domain-containing protein [Candidatus Saganbacteria bacterium]